MKLSHLAFTDDLFFICGDDCKSFHLIIEALQEFYFFPGLQPNLSKTVVFYAGVDAQTNELLSRILPIPEGLLPVRYLNVPLISTRLKVVSI